MLAIAPAHVMGKGSFPICRTEEFEDTRIPMRVIVLLPGKANYYK